MVRVLVVSIGCPYLNQQFRRLDTSEIKFFEISLPQQLVKDSQSISSLEKIVMERGGLSNGERALIEWDHVTGDVSIRSTRFAVFSKHSCKFIH